MSDAPPPPVRVEVLGPLRLLVDGVPVDVPGPKRRAVLALLAFSAGQTIPVGRLVDALWPSEPPKSGRAAVQAHISRLRGHLGPHAGRLHSVSDGYRLDLDATELDVAQARTLLAQSRPQRAEDPTRAFAALQQAHGLWRGGQLADLTDVSDIATAVEQCERLQREVTDQLLDCAIAAGRAADTIGLATARLMADPLSEPVALLAMRTLAAAGQAPESLRVGRGFRTRLADETGLDPSADLGALEREIAGGALGTAEIGRDIPRAPKTRLIGRTAQLENLRRLMDAESLVTVVGPGGVGKTRVALEVARHHPDTAVLLLAPLTDPAAIPHALAAAVNVSVVHGDVLNACAAVLGGRRRLLVVDNCEHLLDAARDTIATLLAVCPDLTVLTTSREPLGLPDEYTYRLAPLPLPVETGDPATAASVELFVDRARRIRPDLAPTPAHLFTVAEIVRRLDGMPLAIELAAGRLSTFSLEDLRDRLDRSLDLIGGGRPTGDLRHRTLRSTIEWSYELLEPDEQKLFRHLAVFADGLDLTDAEQLAADLDLGNDPGVLLAHLVDASVINVDFSDGTRYRLLETIRAFGLDRLAAYGEDGRATERLLDWATGLAADIEAGLMSDHEPAADARLRRERANLRAAWRLARARGSLDAAVRLIKSLFYAISYRDLIEFRDWAEELANDPDLAAHPDAPMAYAAAGESVYHRGDYGRAENFAHKSLQRTTDRSQTWGALAVLSVTALARGNYADAISFCLTETVATPRVAEPYGVAALAALYAGAHEPARHLNDRGRAGATWPTMRSWNAYVDGEIENFSGHPLRAEERYLQAIDIARGCGSTFLVGVATVGLLTVRSSSGRVRQALLGYVEVIDHFARTGNWTHLWAALRNLADLLDTLGDTACASALHAAADAAPDAPAHESTTRRTPLTAPVDRDALLTAARGAIEAQLNRLPHDDG